MRRRATLSVAALFALAALAGACSDPTATKSVPRVQATSDLTAGTCTTLGNLKTLAGTVFGAHSPNVSSVNGKLSNMDKLIKQGDLAGAQDQARSIVSFVQQKAAQGKLVGTAAQVQAFIDGVLCYAGLLTNTFLVFPSDAPQVKVSSDGLAGILLQGSTVAVPTLITITILPSTSSPLITKLDQYPTYTQLTASSPLTRPAVVAVCPDPSVPTDVRARLRLGHQALAGFEITPPADGSFLTCPTGTALGPVGSFLKSLANLVLPKPVYAKMLLGGGVGGTATEFSPFGPVDPVLSASGGVGGTATEFLTMPAPANAPATSDGPRLPTHTRVLVPGKRFNLTIAGVCTSVDALFGTPLDTACRPVVTLTTRLGTIMQNVPVGWVIGLGGGVVAPETPVTRACGTFGSTAANTSDVTGKAGVCWILGPTPGTNTVKATPTAGGDAPVGVTFSPPHFLFTATARTISPTASATSGTFAYSGLAQPGSGSCSHGLTPVLSYSSESAPVNVGGYTLTVTCGAGDPLYTTVAATATITITPLTVTATAGSAAVGNFGPPVPTLACEITGLLPVDAGIISCTTLIPPVPAIGTYVTTPVVTPTSLANYVIVLVTGIFLAL